MRLTLIRDGRIFFHARGGMSSVLVLIPAVLERAVAGEI